MTKILKTICFLTALTVCVNLYAFDMKNVIAAPVPFNPNTHSLKIMHLPDDSDSVTLEVFDAAGDKIAKKTYTHIIRANSLQVQWNGRNDFGKMVSPGLYILKIVARDTKTDAYGMKTIKILVKY